MVPRSCSRSGVHRGGLGIVIIASSSYMTFVFRRSRMLSGRKRLAGITTVALRVELLEARNLLDATTLLISTWNVGIADAGHRLGSYDTVLAGIGNESHYASPLPLGILTISETRSNAYTGAT